MEANNNFRFNPRRYEDHLSRFGGRVLNVLIQKWKSDQIRAQNTNKSFHPSIQNRRILTFRPSSPIKCKDVTTESDFHIEKPFDLNSVERNVCHVPIPTASQLVQAVDDKSSSNYTNDNENVKISSHDLVNALDNNLNDSRPHSTLMDPCPSSSGKEVDTHNSNDVDWENMFDSELYSEFAITDAQLVLKQMDDSVQNTFDIRFLQQTSEKTDPTGKIETNYKKPLKEKSTKSKRKNQVVTDTIPKKVKKVSEKTTISFRKQKYTKAVKNWLEDVDSNNPVEKDEIIKKSEETKTGEHIIMTVEKVVEKPTKKIIQAQLANKDGIMKFRKPKTEKTATKESECNKDKKNVENPVENAPRKIKTVKENKSQKDSKNEKKNKPKFVAPIKSQIPVKDIEFPVTTVDENNIVDHIDTLKHIKHKELVVVLVYSNGFSQLDNRTEGKSEPEGFIINAVDDFYYFKGDFQTNKDILRSLMESNKIICYDGKALLIYAKAKLDSDVHNIDVTDAKIGGCLLEPDSPPENFSELQKLLSSTPQFTIATECALQKIAWHATLLRESASKLTSLLLEEQLWNVFVNIEMKLLPIIAEMEIHGVTVDLHKLKSMEDILLSKMKSRELECFKAAGKSFQINSPVQVRAIVYDELKLDAKCNVKIRETLSKGAKSTSESMLRNLVSEHVLPKLILEYRHLHKAHATFLAGIAQHVKDGIVRPTWVQTAAATGRIASNNPNLQAIPKAPFSLVLFPDLEDNSTDNVAVCMRSPYSARSGFSLLAADFQHVECRVFAHAAADAALRAALLAPRDLFRTLAHTWLQKPVESVTSEDRERTKRIVYASLYGAGVRKLMDLLDVGYDQALSVLASFNRTFPSLKSFGRSVVSRCARGGGRLAAPSGRARRFPHIASLDPARRAHAERQAVNFILQGSAADLCKMAMVVTSQQLRVQRPPVEGRLLLQIHDELVWEVRDQHLDTAAVIIKRAMEGCGYQSGMEVPLPVSLSVGKNWGEMTEYNITQLQ